jgi:RNA polymerase sigma factor (sigma-70 family)
VKFTKEKIIESIRQGRDRDVLNAMYRDIYPKVDRYITSNSGTNDDSRDIFQEAILIFYKNVTENKHDQINDITGFIIRVSRNLWINKVKSKRKQVEIELLENVEDFTPSPLITLIMSEKWIAYNALFESIGLKCRELLTYAVYEKMSMKEIARKMNLSNENTAKTQNYRCRKKLMEIIAENKELKDLLQS